MRIRQDQSDDRVGQDLEGVFWKPESPLSRIHGALHLSSEGDKLTLILHEAEERSDWQEEEPILRLFGVVEGKGNVTLLNAAPTGGWRSRGGVTTVEFWQFTTLFGSHTNSESFGELHLEFEWLDEWTPRRRLVDRPSEGKIQVDVSSETIAATEWGKHRISLDRFVDQHWSPEEVELKNKWLFRIQSEGSLSTVASEWIGPLQDFLMVALGHRPGVLHVWVKTGSSKPTKAWVDARPVWSSMGVSGASPFLVRYLEQTKTLLLPDDEMLPLGDALRTWFDERSELRIVVSMLSAGLRDKNVFPEHKFLSLFIALDLLARTTDGIDQHAIAVQDHKARVSEIASVLKESRLSHSTRNWAVERLSNSNNKSQTRILTEFLELTGLFNDGMAENIAKSLNHFRRHIAHRGVIENVDQNDVVIQHMHMTELAEWVVRAEILIRLGASREQIRQRLFANSLFREVFEFRKWRVS